MNFFICLIIVFYSLSFKEWLIWKIFKNITQRLSNFFRALTLVPSIKAVFSLKFPRPFILISTSVGKVWLNILLGKSILNDWIPIMWSLETNDVLVNQLSNNNFKFSIRWIVWACSRTVFPLAPISGKPLTLYIFLEKISKLNPLSSNKIRLTYTPISLVFSVYIVCNYDGLF